MDFSLLIGSCIGIILGFIILAIILKKEIGSSRKTDDVGALVEWLKSTQNQVVETNKSISEGLRGSAVNTQRVLQENSKQLNERLDTATHVIGELKRNLGEMAEVGKGIKSLQEFLQSPKLRGNIGEQVLEDMIGQTFPKQSFSVQYTFKSGEKVDAVLKTDAGLLCIDSKFPMSNFTKMYNGETEDVRKKAKKDFTMDVRKHMNDIGKKYILPEEGTMDFALMYIPSESVYYELVNAEDLMEEARNARVYPVSPNTLFAHLQVLLVSFQGKELEKKTGEVMRLLRGIAKDYEKIDGDLGVMGKHVTNAYNSMNTVSSSFALMGHKLDQTKMLSDGKEV